MPECADCDAEVELDEPRQCHFTGRGPCGDCRDPATNRPMGCFSPVLCDRCLERRGRRERRLAALADRERTTAYTERRKAELRDRNRGGRFA